MCAKESVIWVPHVTVWTETWGRMDGNLGKQTGCLRDNCCYIIVVNIPSVTVCHAVNIPSVTVCRHRLSRAFFTMVLPGFPLFGALGHWVGPGIIGSLLALGRSQ